MYEKFTDRARKVMQLANQEAARFRHEYIGTEHILLGLIAEGTGVAAKVLKNLDLERNRIRREVEKIIRAGPEMVSMGRLPQTPRAKKVLEYAIEESRALNHDYVGTEHLLLGLLRESEGLASQVLMNLGLRLDTLREEVLNLLGDQVAKEDSPTTTVRQLDEEPNAADLDDDDEDPSEPYEVLGPELRHLPASAREIVAEFDCQIEVVKEAKELAVAVHAFEKAAERRDLEYKLRKLRDQFISHWPKN